MVDNKVLQQPSTKNLKANTMNLKERNLLERKSISKMEGEEEQRRRSYFSNNGGLYRVCFADVDDGKTVQGR